MLSDLDLSIKLRCARRLISGMCNCRRPNQRRNKYAYLWVFVQNTYHVTARDHIKFVFPDRRTTVSTVPTEARQKNTNSECGGSGSMQHMFNVPIWTHRNRMQTSNEIHAYRSTRGRYIKHSSALFLTFDLCQFVNIRDEVVPFDSWSFDCFWEFSSNFIVKCGRWINESTLQKSSVTESIKICVTQNNMKTVFYLTFFQDSVNIEWWVFGHNRCAWTTFRHHRIKTKWQSKWCGVESRDSPVVA